MCVAGGRGVLKERRGLPDVTTLRFLVTGVGAAGLFFVLSFSFVRIGLPAFMGTLLAYAVTFVVAYSVQQAWTFRGARRHGEALPRYLAAQIACGLLSALLARTLVQCAGLPPGPMAAVTTLASSALSYGLSRYWVFSAPRTN